MVKSDQFLSFQYENEIILEGLALDQQSLKRLISMSCSIGNILIIIGCNLTFKIVDQCRHAWP